VSCVNVPGWALAYAGASVVVYLVLYYYLRGDDEGSARDPFADENGGDYSPGSPVGPDRADAAREGRDPSRTAAADESGRRCPHCGARNDPDQTYTYCHRCVQRLGMTP